MRKAAWKRGSDRIYSLTGASLKMTPVSRVMVQDRLAVNSLKVVHGRIECGAQIEERICFLVGRSGILIDR